MASNNTMDSFNLLISSSRGEEPDANSEIRYLLWDLGDKEAKTGFTLVSGLTIAKTSLEPTRVIDELRSTLRESPWKFRYVLKVKPVRAVVPCNTLDIGAAVIDQLSTIRSDETFRISIEKRRSKVPSREIIDAVASRVPRKVKLQNPDKLIMIEVIGSVAGVSIVEPNCILGVEKEKRPTASQLLTRRTVLRSNA